MPSKNIGSTKGIYYNFKTAKENYRRKIIDYNKTKII